MNCAQIGLYSCYVDEFCQALGDANVWGTLYPIEEPLKEPEVVMLATKVLNIADSYK